MIVCESSVPASASGRETAASGRAAVVLYRVVFPSLVRAMMCDVVLYSDQGSVRRVGKSQNAAGEAQHDYR